MNKLTEVSVKNGYRASLWINPVCKNALEMKKMKLLGNSSMNISFLLKYKPPRLLFLLLAICLFGLCAQAQPWSSGETPLPKVIVLSGDQVPEQPEGVEFLHVFNPIINNAGKVVFTAYLTGPGVTDENDDGIWAIQPQTLPTLIARQEDPAPGLGSGVTFLMLGSNYIKMNNLGQISFLGYITGTGIDPNNNGCIWSGTSYQDLSWVARKGEQAPGALAGVVFKSLGYGDISRNNSGQFVFSAKLKGTGISNTEYSFWTGISAADLSLVAREGEAAAGIPGYVYGGLTSSSIVINDSNQIVFNADILQPGGYYYDEGAIWTGTAPENLVVLARDGEHAPGTQTNSDFEELYRSNIKINNTGQIAFAADLDWPSSKDRGIWKGTSSENLTLFVQKGDTAAGTEDNIKFDYLESFKFNNAGQIVFNAYLDVDTNDYGFWMGTLAEDIFLIARAGDPAPGTVSGVYFKYVDASFFSSSNPFNNNGQFVFCGELAGPDVNEYNDTGIWAYDPLLGTILLARSGDQIEVAPGDFRSIGSFYDLQYGLNDDGEVAFTVIFTDGMTGITIFTIPKSSAITGDFDGDHIVDVNDLAVLVEQWLLEKLPMDIAPDGGDGIVNFRDWAVFAADWQNTGNMADVADFASQWLQFGAYSADIAPDPDGDGIVNFHDFSVFAENWLAGVE